MGKTVDKPMEKQTETHTVHRETDKQSPHLVQTEEKGVQVVRAGLQTTNQWKEQTDRHLTLCIGRQTSSHLTLCRGKRKG